MYILDYNNITLWTTEFGRTLCGPAVPVIPAGYNYYLHVILHYCVTFTSIGIRHGPSVGQFPPRWKRNEPKRARSDEDDNNISTRTRTIVQQARIYT